MHTIGIIAEYNPFHSGHGYHIEQIRESFGATAPIVCVMSGNWVQRGDAALCDKWTRAAMALSGGVDLVLELPTPWATSSAEQFAHGGVALLQATGVVDTLSFGSESGALPSLQHAATFLSSADYQKTLRRYLDQGLSFPLARQQATTEALGDAADCLKTPNNNLAVEYLRAIHRLGSAIQPATILRQGTAHDSNSATATFASASHLRRELLAGRPSILQPYLTEETLALLDERGFASLGYATRAVFARLRTMYPEDFLALPDSGEGLHNRLYQAALESHTLEDLYAKVKSRRYTHARIRRLVLWAFLGLKKTDRPAAPPYLRVLGMNQRGRDILKEMKQSAQVPILTKSAHAQKLPPEARRLFELEARCTALYDLCRADFGQRPGRTEYTSNPVII